MNKIDNVSFAITAIDAPERLKPSVYPEPFASMMKGRTKQPLGDLFGINNFGVNLTHLAPGAQSALLHKHSLQEEFIYILEGSPTLVTDQDEMQLKPGMCAGFTPKRGAHHLINRTTTMVIYLEIGDRSKDDKVSYPDDDLVGKMDINGQWQFSHKNGQSY